jgi:transketolase
VLHSFPTRRSSDLPGLNGAFRLKAIEDIRDGNDVLIVSVGSISTEALKAAEMLAADGVSCAVSVIACVNPPPYEDLVKKIKNHRHLVTVESHYRVGGIGSLISEIVAEQNLFCKVTRCGIRALPNPSIGTPEYLNDACGVSSAVIAATVKQALL